MYRKVLPSDILLINWGQLIFKNKKAIVGDFTNVYHSSHG
jgi:hypothetical protein